MAFRPVACQWSEAAPREEPYAFVLVAAVNDVDAVAHDCVVESGAGILSHELEERLTPRIIRITKDLIPEHLQFFNGDRADGVCHGFAPLFVEVLKIKFFEWHGVEFSSLNIVRQAMLSKDTCQLDAREPGT
jgi:hypothetical protein